MRSVTAFLLVVCMLSACCLGNRKCMFDDYGNWFRILSPTGTDLVFGPAAVYNKDSIRFFSINGNTVVPHHYGAIANPQPGQDSLLAVDFDYAAYTTVYIKLTAADTDTLELRYQEIDASDCCPAYKEVTPVLVNSRTVERMGTAYIIRK